MRAAPAVPSSPTFEVLKDLTVPLATALETPHLDKIIRIGNETCRAYFASHARGLFRLAFSSEKTVTTARAFSILNCGDRKCLQPLLSSGTIIDFACRLLDREPVSPILVGRLAQLTLVLLTKLPELASIPSGYLFRLLSYCENLSVYHLFQGLTTVDSALEPTQSWLVELGFPEYLLRELQAIDFSYRSPLANIYSDPIYNRAFYYFELIGQSALHPILRTSFQTDDFLVGLQGKFPDMPDFVNIARWRAVVCATCEETIQTAIRLFLKESIDVLSERFEHLKEYRVLAIIFVAKLMRISDSVYEELLKSSVAQLLSNLVFQLPNSTLLHREVTAFVKTGLANEAFALELAAVFVPPVLAACQSENCLIRSYCFKIISIFAAAQKALPALSEMLERDVPEFRVIVKTTLKEYGTKLKAVYGGDKNALPVPLPAVLPT
jgi:hypothetical protein